jgi:hypothetical protein
MTALATVNTTHPAKKQAKPKNAWSKTDVAALRAASKGGTPAKKLARALKRTEGAVRQKAFSLGLSLRVMGKRKKR